MGLLKNVARTATVVAAAGSLFTGNNDKTSQAETYDRYKHNEYAEQVKRDQSTENNKEPYTQN